MVLDEIFKANEHNCKRNMKNCSITTTFKDVTVQFADKLGASKLTVIQCNFYITIVASRYFLNNILSIIYLNQWFLNFITRANNID